MFESIAYAAAGGGAEGQGAPNPLVSFMPLILMFGIFYFLLIRPQQKQRQQLQKMVENLKKGDRVVTSGGIIGIITSIQNDYLVIKTGGSDNVKMEILKSSVTGLRQQG
ncbi:MAG: preprotein translocase subunit YajC [Candidatus Omnitrophota bacterium]|nr:preprotein translocase subunit YajC [Candidatus Omnitrophota bacterium]